MALVADYLWTWHSLSVLGTQHKEETKKFTVLISGLKIT